MTKMGRHIFFIKWNMNSKIIEGHNRLLEILFIIYKPILRGGGDYVNDNFMIKWSKTSNITFMSCKGFRIFFVIRPSYLITTLTYIFYERLLSLFYLNINLIIFGSYNTWTHDIIGYTRLKTTIFLLKRP